MKKVLLVAAVGAALMLTGCDEEKDAKFKNPAILQVGTFDGCTVKYIDRGYRDYSFYIAKCDATTALTGGYNTGGKSNQYIPQVTITNEEDLDARIAELKKLEAEKQAIDKRKAALAKLTPEEKQALGIK